MGKPRYENNLGTVRRWKKVTQDQVAADNEIPVSTLRKYEQELTPVPGTVIKKLAEYYHVTSDALLYPGYPLPGSPMCPSAKTLPVVGRIAAGPAREAIETMDGRMYIPGPLYEEHPHAFYLRVSGDSMNRRFGDGMLVLVDPESPVNSGDVGAVLVNGDDATVKRVFFGGDTVILHPESYSPEYHDVTIDRTDPMAPEFRIIGKVIWFTPPENWRP